MNPDIQPHELADMRIAADKAPFGVQQKFHALLDVYEDIGNAMEKCESTEAVISGAEDELRAVYSQPSNFEEPLSDDAWHETLEGCDTPEGLLQTVADELERARAAEAKLLVRVEELEVAVETALEKLTEKR